VVITEVVRRYTKFVNQMAKCISKYLTSVAKDLRYGYNSDELRRVSISSDHVRLV